MEDAIAAVDRGFVAISRGTVEMPPRSILRLADQDGYSYVMPAYVGGQGALGLKVLNFYRPAGGQRERGGGMVLLFDAHEGTPLALMDARFITDLRTGAASAVATQYLTPRDVKTVGLLGTGNQARTQLLGLRAVRPITSIKAWGRTRARARTFAQEMSKALGCQITLVDEPREAVAKSQIIVTATNSEEPVLRGEWLEKGMHINSIGGATTNEIDAEVLRRSRVFVDSMEGALKEARDIQLALKAGAIGQRDLIAALGDVITGKVAGRRTLDEVTLFRSLGLGMEDVVTAQLVYGAAKDAGVGKEVEFP